MQGAWRKERILIIPIWLAGSDLLAKLEFVAVWGVWGLGAGENEIAVGDILPVVTRLLYLHD